MPLTSRIRKIKVYFLANFHSSDFGYALYPFLRIFKICGFAPIKLKQGDVLRHKREQLVWHVAACIWTFIAVAIYVVGFSIGVHHLHLRVNATDTTHDSTIIAHFTSWAQIVMLFILGAVALLTSWTHMQDMQRLCSLIFTIDRHLKKIDDIKIDYQQLRKRLFREMWIQFSICFPLSMVNCIIIQPDIQLFSLVSTCFWFICFAPIMLVTFKEFQFYNLMFILKSKIDIVNEKLQVFVAATTSGGKERRKLKLMHKLQSVSEIPLTAVTVEANLSTPNATTDDVEKPSVETLQKLLEIYSCIADGLELVLKIFAWHLLLFTTISFGVITVESYNLFALIKHSLKMQPYQIVIITAWILVQIMAIGINVSACSMTSKTMSSTISLLHKIKPPTNLETEACLFYQILQLFSLEILQRKYNFTAAGFFDMNYKLITSIVGAVTTYLVIIIQFHLTNIPDCHYTTPAA